MITNLIKLPIVLQTLHGLPNRTSQKWVASHQKGNFFRRTNSVSSCQVVDRASLGSINNGVSVDLIRQGGSI